MESQSAPVPIILSSSLDLNLYPEGGYLIMGVPNTVYWEARAADGSPRDLSAQLCLLSDSASPSNVTATVIQLVSTRHHGRGHFTFLPTVSGHGRYALQLTASPPTGLSASESSASSSVIARRVLLPPVEPLGVVLHATQPVYAFGDPIAVELHVAAGRGRRAEDRQQRVVEEYAHTALGRLLLRVFAPDLSLSLSTLSARADLSRSSTASFRVELYKKDRLVAQFSFSASLSPDQENVSCPALPLFSCNQTHCPSVRPFATARPFRVLSSL